MCGWGAFRLSASWLCQDEDSLFIAQDLGEVKRGNGENAGLKCGGKHGIIKNKIAKEKGISRMSAQAVGGAVGSNKIGIIIPCHRVVGANGNLTGYAGGIYNKEALLRLEGVDMSGMYIQQ